MGMCAGKKMKGYADGGEIDPEMQRQIDALKAKHNAPPKPSMFSGLFSGSAPKPQAAPPAQPATGMIGAIQNRNEELKKAANYADGGMIGNTIDMIKNRHMQNNAAMREEGGSPSAQPINYDAERQRQSDAALARKMAEVQPKEKTYKPGGLLQAMGFSNGGKIKGPGTPTSDSIPAQVKQTGEPIAVSTGERILSKKQDMFLQKIAQGAGFDSLDAMLEHGTGKPVGPTMKGGMAAAEYGANPDDIIRSGNSFSQSSSPASAALTDVNSYGNSMTQANKMNANPAAFAAREPGMAGKNIYDNGAGTSTGLSGAVNFTSSDASTITPPPMNGVGAQPQQQAIAQPLSTGSADLDTLGTDQGSAPKFANKSMSDIAKEQGIGNMAYRPGGLGDPNASNPMARQAAPVQRQRRQAPGLMPTVDDMFQKRGFAGGGKPEEEGYGGGYGDRLTLDSIRKAIGINDPSSGITGAEGQPHPSLAIRGVAPMNAQATPTSSPVTATGAPVIPAGSRPATQQQAPMVSAASTQGFTGQRVTDSGAVSGRSNVDATKLQAPDGGGIITNAQGKAMFLPPQAIAARDPNGQYDANGNNMARTNAMKAELAGMQRDRLIRDMGADITSPGTRYAAQQQIAQLDKGQGMALLADRAQRDDVTAGLDQQGKRNSLAEYANLQKAIDEYSKMPAGQERDAAMEAIAARQGRNLPDRSQLIHAAGGSDPNDPMGMRKLGDRVYLKDRFGNVQEVTAQQNAKPKPAYADFEKAYLAKKPGTDMKKIKSDYEELHGAK